MRQLATIQKIADVQPIEGADAIEKVKVKDWWCVSKKGEFKTGDLCVYFEIDSLLPSDNPIFSFLEKGTKVKTMVIDGVTYTGYRLKTVRLRGQISQGLALPVHLVLGESFVISGENVTQEELRDVSQVLGVVKYEAPIPAQLAGKIKGQFPSFLKKTDEERIQNCANLIAEYPDTNYFVTEKLDGSSATFYKKDGVFGVCSRNLDLLDTEGNSFWDIAKRYDLMNKLPDGVAIQGELVGPGVQGNPLKLNETEVYFFNVYDIDNGEFYDFDEMVKFCLIHDLKRVPLVDGLCKISLDLAIEDFINMADGKSLINPESDREGLVFRPHKEMLVTLGKNDNQRFSFKVISNNYLLNEK